MGKIILEILQEMYGSKFVRDLIGTRTNVVKPKQFDSNAPTKNTYSEDAFKDPKLLDTIEEKLIEYAPFQIANRSKREQENYLANLKKFRDARKKEQGITAQTESVKEVKPEAEIFDIGTKKKVGEEGIMTLKSEIGLPKGVEPGSLADKAIKESAEYKMRQQGVKSLLDEDYKPPKTTTIEEDEAFEFEKFDKDPYRPGGPLDPAVGITRAGARLILENKGIKIGSKDPLDLVRENFGQDFLNDINNVSEEMLEIDRSGGSYADLIKILKREGLYDAPINKDAPKGYTTEEMKKIMDEADEKDLGDKLKDLDDDIPDMAEGGRIGYDKGGPTGLATLAALKSSRDDDLKLDPVGIVMEGEPKSSNFDNVFLEAIEEFKEKAKEPIKYTDGITYYPEFNSFFDEDFNEVSGPSKGAIPVDERDQEVIPQKRLEAAIGGRMGFSAGKVVGLKIAKFFSDKGLDLARELKKAVDDIFPSGDRKLDADVVVDNMLEDLGVDRDMFDQKEISELYGMAYDTLSEGSVPKGLAAFMSKKGKGEVKMADEVELTEDMKIKNQTRRALDELQDYKEVLPEFYTRMTLKLKYPGISDDMIKKIMTDNDPQRIQEVMATMDEGLKMLDKGMSPEEIINTFKKTPRTKQAGGGLSYLMGM